MHMSRIFVERRTSTAIVHAFRTRTVMGFAMKMRFRGAKLHRRATTILGRLTMIIHANGRPVRDAPTFLHATSMPMPFIRTVLVNSEPARAAQIRRRAISIRRFRKMTGRARSTMSVESAVVRALHRATIAMALARMLTPMGYVILTKRGARTVRRAIMHRLRKKTMALAATRSLASSAQENAPIAMKMRFVTAKKLRDVPIAMHAISNPRPMWTTGRARLWSTSKMDAACHVPPVWG